MASNRARSLRRGETKDTPAELNFDDDRASPPLTGYAGRGSDEDDQASLFDEGGLSETVDNTASADDLSPETLLDENGGGSPLISAKAVDAHLSLVDEDDIGGGTGLDEAELAIAEGGGPSDDDEDDFDDDEDDEDDEDDLDDEDEEEDDLDEEDEEE